MAPTPIFRRWLYAFFLHYAAYLVMQTLALLAETRRGPAVPDLMATILPYVPQIEHINSTFWSIMLLASIVWLSVRYTESAIDYLRAGAILSLLRGFCIVLTSLGPPNSLHASVLMKHLQLSDISLSLLAKLWFPVEIIGGSGYASAAWLTQDMFFSGHTSSTFLLVLIAPDRQTRLLFLVYHVITVAALLLTQVHYGIDIVGGYLASYAVYHFCRNRKWLISGQTRKLANTPGRLQDA
jgi:hypothetical protein